MESLILAGTDDTPNIHFDYSSGKLEISGRSMPEDIMKFYQTVIDWLKNYIETPQENTIVDFKMIYFNSSSSKIIAEIVSIFEGLELKKNSSVCIHWHYNENDDEMKEAGEELEDIYNVPFKFISSSY